MVRALLILLLIASCKTQERIVEVEKIVHDTIREVRIKEVQPEFKEVVFLDQICDTVEVVKFKKQFVINKDTIYLETKDNSLRLEISRAKRVLKESDSLVSKLKESVLHRTKEASTRTRQAWFLLIYAIGVTIYAFRKQLKFLIKWF